MLLVFGWNCERIGSYPGPIPGLFEGGVHLGFCSFSFLCPCEKSAGSAILFTWTYHSPIFFFAFFCWFVGLTKMIEIKQLLANRLTDFSDYPTSSCTPGVRMPCLSRTFPWLSCATPPSSWEWGSGSSGDGSCRSISSSTAECGHLESWFPENNQSKYHYQWRPVSFFLFLVVVVCRAIHYFVLSAKLKILTIPGLVVLTLVLNSFIYSLKYVKPPVWMGYSSTCPQMGYSSTYPQLGGSLLHTPTHCVVCVRVYAHTRMRMRFVWSDFLELY